MITEQLYFIAIILPEPIKDQVQKIKQEFANCFGATHALKSPPHITLIPPFKTSSQIATEVAEFLEKTSQEVNAFQLIIKDFSCFKPRVIFLNPLLNQELEVMQKHLQKEFYRKFPFGEPSLRPFHPHLTIAFRDLTPKMFYKAWPIYKNKTYGAQFMVDRIYLLRHNGKIWQEFKGFTFGNPGLPT